MEDSPPPGSGYKTGNKKRSNKSLSFFEAPEKFLFAAFAGIPQSLPRLDMSEHLAVMACDSSHVTLHRQLSNVNRGLLMVYRLSGYAISRSIALLSAEIPFDIVMFRETDNVKLKGRVSFPSSKLDVGGVIDRQCDKRGAVISFQQKKVIPEATCSWLPSLATASQSLTAACSWTR